MKIHFKNPENSPFQTELNFRVNEYFKSGNISKKANFAMILKMVIIFCVIGLTYGLLLSNRLTESQMLFMAVIFGFSQVLMAFNIGHDAAHGALFESKKLNSLFSYTFNLTGISSYIWNIKHNLSHHHYTNVPGHDLDIEQTKLARVTPDSPLKPFHRYQHLYLPFIYPFFSIFLVFVKDFLLFAKGTYGNKIIKHPTREYVILIASKILYVTYVLIIPLIVIDLPWYKIMLGFIVMHMVLGSFIVLILFPGHLHEDAVFLTPDDKGNVSVCWVSHQVECTINTATNSRLVHWISGGLNTHIAHHLFPKTCHIHYYELSKIIRDVCVKHDVKYVDQGLFEGLVSHFRFLKSMGNPSEKDLMVHKPGLI
jgi:linoleoyl-CoA desaturase